MKNSVLIKSLAIICPALMLMFSCSEENPSVTPEVPDPDPIVYNKCPNDGDIYKLVFDTLILNSKREMFTIDSLQINYKLDNAMPLGVCEKTADLYGSAKYSPLAAKVKTDEGVSRDMKWDRHGYFRDLILADDIDRILKFTDGKKIIFELSLVNAYQDVIQTNPITIIYREKFPEK